VLSDRFHNVNYKTVVRHFEELMSILAADSGGTKIEWPPDAETIALFGGVGLGPVKKAKKMHAAKQKSSRRSRKKTTSHMAVSEADLEIPPLLRSIHPKLAAHDYRRYKRDPLFLFKKVSVCENCYLVFAEIAGAVLDAEPSKTLASKSSLRASSTNASWLSESARRRRRDKEKRSRRLRAGSAPGKKGSRTASGSQATAASGSLQSGRMFGQMPSTAPAPKIKRRLQSPELPPRIDANNVHDLAVERDMPLLSASLSASSMAREFGRSSSADAVVRPGQMRAQEPDAFRQTLRDREDAFFRDLYKNPNLRKGHPLRHMITSQAKLEMARAQSSPQLEPLVRASTPGGYLQSPSVAASPYLIAQSSGLASAFDGRRSPASRGGARSASPNSSRARLHQLRRGNDSIELDSSARHRDFLLNTLQEVRSQLTNPSALVESVGISEAADIAGESIVRGESLDAAMRARNDAVGDASASSGPVFKHGVEVDGRHYMVTIQHDGSGEYTLTCFEPATSQTSTYDVSDMGQSQRITVDDVRSIVRQIHESQQQ